MNADAMKALAAIAEITVSGGAQRLTALNLNTRKKPWLTPTA